MSARWRLLSLAFVASVAAGCASVPRDAGFSDVRRMVEERTGQQLEWNLTQPVAAPTAPDHLADALGAELTPDEAVAIALANNRDLLATLEELGVARADFVAASTVRNPVFDAEIRFPGEPRKPFELALTQTLIDLVQLGKRRAFGRAAFEAARVRVTGAVLSFAAEVRTDYYDLQAAREILAQQRAITAAAEASAHFAHEQHVSGNISDLDLESEQANLERAKLELAAAGLAELQARERLLQDLGVAGPLELRLVAQDAAIQREERTPEQIEAALGSRLDIALAEAELETARRRMPVARSAFLDELAIGVHREREPEGKATTGPAVAVPVPIFNRGAADRLRAAAMLRQAEQRLHALRAAAQSEARGAGERLGEARARAEYLRDVVVPRRQRILALTQIEYNAMLRGVFDLIRARQDLADAERERVAAIRDYWVARTDLETALSGVARFSVRGERIGPERPELFRPHGQPDNKEDE